VFLDASPAQRVNECQEYARVARELRLDGVKVNSSKRKVYSGPADVRADFEAAPASELQRQIVQNVRLVSAQKAAIWEVWIDIPSVSDVLAKEGVGNRAKRERTEARANSRMHFTEHVDKVRT